MRDSAAQKELIASGKGSTQANMEWVWDFDPVKEWDQEPLVPAID